MNPAQRKSDPRSGIALIIVIGFLSVLVILGVGFAIAMRTERLTSRYFAEDVNARHLIPRALHTAMEMIDTQYAGAMYIPTWNSGSTWAGYRSGGAGELVTNPPFASSSYFTSAIPTAVRSTSQWGQARWVEITSGVGADPNEVIGRIACVADDLSGLVDANYIGITNIPGVNRAIHIEPTTLLSEFSDPANVSRFIARRLPGHAQPITRFEDVADIWIEGLHSYPAGSTRFLRSQPDSLVAYSHAPNGFWDGATVQSRAYIGTNSAQLSANKAEIVAALMAGGLDATQADNTHINLLDYLDSADVPQGGVGHPHHEATPLINEFQVQVTSVAVPDPGGVNPPTYDLSATIQVELFYPYVTDEPGPYELQVFWQPQNGVPPFGVDSRMGAISGSWSFNDYRNVALPAWVRNFPSEPLHHYFYVVLRRGANPVDQAGAPGNSGFLLGATAGTVGYQVRDPRFNWDVTPAANQWQSPGGSTLDPANPENSNFAAEPPFYVRNDGRLGSVSEFRFLPDPTTIGRTLQGNTNVMKAVLNRLATVDPAVEHGRINPNAHLPRVPASVFYNMPVREYPTLAADHHGGGLTSVDAGRAQQLGTAVYNNRFYTNRADLVHFLPDASLPNGGAGATGYTAGQMRDLRAWGLMDSCWELFNPRQNLWGIVLAAQSGEIEPGGTEFIVQTERRAFAYVWRDPYPNADGIHPNFVRLFFWEKR
ncbi:MAG: hypothetical protein K9N49_07505 [Candidatus Marinimicrobia bacterium]|nr:hypothetical protein [Candidatus Neomarinimicrobiota bacterium]